MILSFELQGTDFLDTDTFVMSCEWTKNVNENCEPIYCEVEVELHLDTRDEYIGINFFDYNGEYIDSIDARNELTELECEELITKTYNIYYEYIKNKN